jgi:prepilin-type N-terminal cleavage/methylation domain-containing protein
LRCGFTLIELLVVVALIAILTGLLLGGLPGGGKAVALQSAQATLANAIATARTQARASGRSVRLLVHVDPARTGEPSRFLRGLVLQRQDGSTWTTLTELHLPPGVYLVPGNFGSIPSGLFEPGETAAWRRVSSTDPLRSTALRDGEILSLAVEDAEAARWCGITFAAAGTTMQSGDLVLAAGRARPPDSFSAGESPVRLENAEAVRGLSLSTYGVVTLIDDRNGF